MDIRQEMERAHRLVARSGGTLAVQLSQRRLRRGELVEVAEQLKLATRVVEGLIGQTREGG